VKEEKIKMDTYDYEQIDKTMSKKIDAIYSDPKRHAFYSQWAAMQDGRVTGPRGGLVVGRKRICFHCGKYEQGHSDKTEQL
jgi:hypothetical protein